MDFTKEPPCGYYLSSWKSSRCRLKFLNKSTVKITEKQQRGKVERFSRLGNYFLETHATNDVIDKMDYEIQRFEKPSKWRRRSKQRPCATTCSSANLSMMHASWKEYLLKNYTDRFENACTPSGARAKTLSFTACCIIWRCKLALQIAFGRELIYYMVAGQPRGSTKERTVARK